MSDYSNPGLAGNEPTVPFGSPADDSQALTPAVEPTVIDPFGSAGSDYPDFSYQPSDSSAPQRDSRGISPDPLVSAASYAPPAMPTDPAFMEPTPPVAPALQYQQYPAPMAPAPMAPAPMVAPYGVAPYAYAPLPEHPASIPSLVLGLVGLLVMIPFASPIAWYLAARGRRESSLQPGRWRSSGMLTAGLILGIIGTIIWVLFTLAFVVALITD